MEELDLVYKERAVIVNCPERIDTDITIAIEKLAKEIIEEDKKKIIVLDFSNVQVLNAQSYRPFVVLQKMLKAGNSYLFTINLSVEMMKQIRNAGLDTVFYPVHSFNDALEKAGIKTKRAHIDVKFINPFLNAVKKTLEIQASTQVKIGKPRLKTENEELNIGLAATLSITSNVFQGSLAVCFPKQVYLNVYENMFGEKHPEITKELEDAAGELLNIIFGVAKTELNEHQKFNIQKAIPTVIRGDALKVHHMSRNVAVVLPFETSAGTFHLEISVEDS